MRPLRLFLTDRLNGGILAALLSYALIVQSVAGGIASVSMSEAHIARPGIDCATSGSIHNDHDRGDRLHECCVTLCLIACGSGIGLPPNTSGTCLGPAYVAYRPNSVIAGPAQSHPRRAGILREARAPPHLSA